MMYDKVSWKANYNLVGYLVKLKFHSPLKMRSRVFFKAHYRESGRFFKFLRIFREGNSS